MSDLDWESCKPAFEWDGMLCDIYVLDTDEEDWKKLIAFLLTSGYPLNLRASGEVDLVPDRVSQLFVQSDRELASLQVDVNGLILMCHFFCREQIEFDLDTRDMNEERFPLLLQFMQAIGELLKKDAILTPEGGEDRPFCRFVAAQNRWEWLLGS